MTEFITPEFWSFKPFFTLQPVASTREKQLNCWRSLILQYCTHNRLTRFEPARFPLFRNASIDRSLTVSGIAAVTQSLIRSGNAEWEDSTQTWLRIILVSPESLAGEIYGWVIRNDFLGTVMTVYELHSGDDYQDSGFYGVDPVILRRALSILEREGKCSIIEGSTPEDTGVKFLSIA